MRLSPLVTGWTAGMAGFVTAMGAVVGLPPAAADVGAEVPYVCTTSSGVHQVKAQIRLNVPTRGVAGRPVRLGAVGLTLTVPATLRAELLKGTGDQTAAQDDDKAGDALPVQARISASARLGISLSQGGKSADADWPLFKVSGGQGKGTGDRPWTLTGTANAPSVLPEVPGKVTWSARELALAFTVPSAGGGSSSPAVVCTTENEVRLGATTVQGSAQSNPGPAPQPRAAGEKRSVQDPSENADCVRVPDYKTDPAWDFNTDPRLWNVFEDPPLPDPRAPENWMEFPVDPATRRGAPYCIRAAGFASVKKMGASAPIAAQTALRRALYQLQPNPASGNTANYVQQRSYFKNYTRPSIANTLSFGFMPTKATTLIDQVAPPGSGSSALTTGNLRSDIALNAQAPAATRNGVELADENWARAYVQTRVRDVNVNGLPIDVGPRCKSAPTMFELYLFLGNSKVGRTGLTQGGTLTGEVDLPKFTGCGVGEDLSPLLNASISGPGNRVQVEAGFWCPTAVSTEACDQKREPRTWTLKPGGTLEMKQAPFVLSKPDVGAEVRCESLVMKAKLKKKGRWYGRFLLGSIPSVKFSDCKMKIGSESVDTDVTADKLPWAFSINELADDGSVSIRISSVLLNVPTVDYTDPGSENPAKCAVRFGTNASYVNKEMPGLIAGSYDNEGTLKLNRANSLSTTFGGTCATPPPGYEHESIFNPGDEAGDITFTPVQKFLPSWTPETNP